ncbi:uncharacterized protein LOC120276112 [Dioscorea cayenensis subsp. rotundata]|uniref:Uncharacterized protein LOC120276112 n=1 Tax=Dioscorea cayennensis subsp. rotundata TaxID=55577 RepID=A0AB40CKP8_DIOCR|nr:uncharacterized protein LOC120276112 [Dioscorea cayenensis subsp. rotundata]
MRRQGELAGEANGYVETDSSDRYGCVSPSLLCSQCHSIPLYPYLPFNHVSSLFGNYLLTKGLLCIVELLKAGATIILHNAKIDMFKGSMRLAIGKCDRVEVTDPAEFMVKENNNLSLVEYELVNVVED